MKTSKKVAEIRMNQWADIIQDRLNSGKTINEYCKEHQLSRNTYLYWLRKLRERAVSDSSTFAELPAPVESVSEVISEEVSVSNVSSSLSMEVNGIKIIINETTNKRLLTMACEVAAHVK